MKPKKKKYKNRSITKNSDDYDENIWKSNLIQMTSYL